MRMIMEEYKKIGKTKEIPKELVEEKLRKCRNLKSDDEHIIALAQAGGVKVLVSDDNNLIEDFTNPKLIQGGQVYQIRTGGVYKTKKGWLYQSRKGQISQARKNKKLLEKVDCS